jgi:hypothetical protein
VLLLDTTVDAYAFDVVVIAAVSTTIFVVDTVIVVDDAHVVATDCVAASASYTVDTLEYGTGTIPVLVARPIRYISVILLTKAIVSCVVGVTVNCSHIDIYIANTICIVNTMYVFKLSYTHKRYRKSQHIADADIYIYIYYSVVSFVVRCAFIKVEIFFLYTFQILLLSIFLHLFARPTHAWQLKLMPAGACFFIYESMYVDAYRE